MASRLEATSALLLEKYEGDMSKLRDAAGKDPKKERKLVKQFKVWPTPLTVLQHTILSRHSSGQHGARRQQSFRQKKPMDLLLIQ